MYLGSYKIDDLLTFYANTHTPSTGAAVDADAVPGYRVYEDETGTPILTGSMALLDDANTVGFYSEQVTLSTVNGLEKGKCYTVRVTGVVGGVTGILLHQFQIEAEVDANTISSTGTALTAIPWNANWDVEVESEANDALVANNLDHLALTATAAADMTTEVADNTVLSRILGNGDTSTFVPSTDGLHAAGVDLDAILLDTGTTLEADLDAIIAAVITNAAGVDIAADIIAVKADTAAILTDTGTTLEADLDAIIAAVITNAAGVDIAADIIAVKADTAAILTDTGTTLEADLDAIIAAVITNAAGVDIAADIIAVKAETASILTDTAEIGAAGAGLTAVPWNATWDAEVQSEVDDALDTIVADSVPADGTRPTFEQALYMIWQFLAERSVSGTTVTVKKADGSTGLMTFTLNDATTPTSITRAT